MNKKIYLLFLLIITIIIFNSKCSFKIQSLSNVGTTVYIDSIGIDYNDKTDKYILYYHSTTSYSLITSEMGSINSNATYCIASSEKDNLYDAIKEISLNTNRNILLTHVRSVVFSLNFINEDNLKMFNEFIKTYKFINIDFNMYVTDTNLKELFSFKNPEITNSYYSIITEIDNIIPFNAVKYNNFANSMYEQYIPVKLIYISNKKTIWEDNNGSLNTLYIKGLVYYKDNNLVVLPSNNFKFLNLMFGNYETNLIFNDICYTLINPKLSIKINEIKLSSSVYITNSNNENKNMLLKELEYNIHQEFNKLYYYTSSNNIDIFMIKDKLYRYNKLNNNFSLISHKFTFDFNLKILS